MTYALREAREYRWARHGTLSAGMTVSGGKPPGMSTRDVAAASYY